MNIVVVGLGAIGGNLAQGLGKNPTFNVWGVDKDPFVLQKAIEENRIEKAYPLDTCPYEEADLIFICLYPKDTLEFTEKYLYRFKENTILTDVSGVKSQLSQGLSNLGRSDIDFILGHPMAGSHKSGSNAWDIYPFKGSNYILVDTQNNQASNVILLKKIIMELGFSHITLSDHETHDKMIAYTSQLLHIMSVSIDSAAPDNEPVENFIGTSFREFTRIAQINSTLWTELFSMNKDYLLPYIQSCIHTLTSIEEALAHNDTANLKTILEQSGY